MNALPRDVRLNCPPHKAANWHRRGSLVILSLSAGEQFTDIVITKPAPQPQRGWLQDLLKSDAQRRIDDFFKWFAEFGRALPGFGRHVRIERQGGSHTGILMPHAKGCQRLFANSELRIWREPPTAGNPINKNKS